MPELVHLLIWVLVLGLVFYLCYWVIGLIPLPEPFGVVAKVILGIIALLLLVSVLLPIAGSPPLIR